MNKTKKSRIRQNNKKGGKNKNCKTKCKNKFLNEIRKNKKYQMIQKIASFFTKKNVVKNQAKLVLDSEDVQNDEVFKDCVKKCEK